MRRKREPRSIHLDELAAPLPPPPKPDLPPGIDFELKYSKETTDADGTKHFEEKIIRRRRKQRVIIIRSSADGPHHQARRFTRETMDARISFATVLRHTEVVEDAHHNETPWESCDGYEHDIQTEEQWLEEIESRLALRFDYDYYKIEAYMKRCGLSPITAGATTFRNKDDVGWSEGREEYVRVIPTYDFKHVYDYAREKGASKGVAQELVHCARRKTTFRLLKWLIDGWQWYGVEGKLHGETESVWGIDDPVYAEEYARQEIAEQLAHALEAQGWLIVKKPKDRRERREGAAARFKRNLAYQNWDDSID